MAEPTAVTEPELRSYGNGESSRTVHAAPVDVGGWATRGTRTREPSGNRNLWTEDFSNPEYVPPYGLSRARHGYAALCRADGVDTLQHSKERSAITMSHHQNSGMPANSRPVRRRLLFSAWRVALIRV